MNFARTHSPNAVRVAADQALSGLSAWWVVFTQFSRPTNFSLSCHFRDLRSVAGNGDSRDGFAAVQKPFASGAKG